MSMCSHRLRRCMEMEGEDELTDSTYPMLKTFRGIGSSQTVLIRSFWNRHQAYKIPLFCLSHNLSTKQPLLACSICQRVA